MKEAGFTLIEVLASLMIFSVAIMGLTHAGTESTRAVSVLNEKMLAGIIADNQIILARQSPLSLGTQRGTVQALAQEFDYNLVTKTTAEDGFFEIKVKVSRKDDTQTILERVAYRKPSS